MPEPTLEEAASRLGAVYSALFRARQLPMDAWALPKWMEPKRLRPLGGFGLTSKIDLALSPIYFGWLAINYPLMSQYHNHQAYERDLRVFYTPLARLLPGVVNESLQRQERELRGLFRRFNSPGIEDRLHESALRIREASGGTTPTREDLQEIDSKRKVPLLSSTASAREQFEFREGRNPVTRARVLKALKAEREKIETENAEPLDPREEQAQGNAMEISALLTMFAVHPDTVKLLDLYAESPLKGTERMNTEIQAAVEATASLRQRLTREDPDDAWGYAPFVLAAVTRLKLHDVAGLPEFSVAMGRVLAKTKTDAVLSAATMVMVGLSLAFTGPAGAVVVGMLDLALAGADAALTIIRMHEQEIAATASDFSPEELKLAEHAHGEDAALSVAGAFLSAIALVDAAKPLLRTRPRAPEVLKTESRAFSPARLELDEGDRAGKFLSKTGETDQRKVLEQINASLGDPNVLTKEVMQKRAEKAGTRKLVGETREYTPEKMRRQGAKTDPAVRVDPGKDVPKTPREYQGSVREFDEAGMRANQDAALQSEKPREYQGSVREYDLADMPARPDAAREPPDLEALYKRERVTTREQITGLYERDPFYPKFEEQKAMLIQSGAPDPIIPNYKFSKKNPPHVDHVIPENQVRKFDGFTGLDIEYQRQVLHMEKNLELVSSAVNLSRGDMPYSLWEGTKDFKMSPEVRKAKIAQEKALAIEIQNKIYSLLEQQRQLRGTTRPPTAPIKAGSRLTGDVSRGLRLVDERGNDRSTSGR